MKKGKRLKSFAHSIGTGIFAVFLFLLFYIAANKNTAPFMLIIREVFPLYDEGVTSVINLYAFGRETYEYEQEQQSGRESDDLEEVFETFPSVEESGNKEKPESPEEPENADEPETGLIGLKNVIYQPETDISIRDNSQTELLTKADLEKFKDFDYLRSMLYTVDKRTGLFAEDIDVEGFLSMDFKLRENEDGPKVLIFHTHSQESYIDSREGDLTDGIFAVGDRLAELLQTKYGITALHDKSSYDIIDGKSSTLGAYERMEGSIREILDKNPSIEVVIDMHRDGVADNMRFATDINGKPTAKIMFFNGLCRVYSEGELTRPNGLINQYTKENLAFSFNLQLLANELFPGSTRKIYINAYRYSLHFKPKSILVEVGAQTNTKQEALNAMEPLAEILARTLK